MVTSHLHHQHQQHLHQHHRSQANHKHATNAQDDDDSAKQVHKGWLSRLTRKQWSRHWFVLRNGSLTYYRGPAAELCSFLDGVLDLSLIKQIDVPPQDAGNGAGGTGGTVSGGGTNSAQNTNNNNNTNGARHLHQPVRHFSSAASGTGGSQASASTFTFSLKMWNGESHVLAAASAADRSLWLHAINCSISGDDSDGLQGDDDDESVDDDEFVDNDDSIDESHDDDDDNSHDNSLRPISSLAASRLKSQAAAQGQASPAMSPIDTTQPTMEGKGIALFGSKHSDTTTTRQRRDKSPDTESAEQPPDFQALKRRLVVESCASPISTPLAAATTVSIHKQQIKNKPHDEECDSAAGSSAGSQLSVAGACDATTQADATKSGVALVVGAVEKSGVESALIALRNPNQDDLTSSTVTNAQCKVRKRVTFDLSGSRLWRRPKSRQSISKCSSQALQGPQDSCSESDSSTESTNSSSEVSDDDELPDSCNSSGAAVAIDSTSQRHESYMQQPSTTRVDELYRQEASRDQQLDHHCHHHPNQAQVQVCEQQQNEDDDEGICEMIRNLIAQRRDRLAAEAEARRGNSRAEPMELAVESSVESPVALSQVGDIDESSGQVKKTQQQQQQQQVSLDLDQCRPQRQQPDASSMQAEPRIQTQTQAQTQVSHNNVPKERLQDAELRKEELEVRVLDEQAARARLELQCNELRAQLATRLELNAREQSALRTRLGELSAQLARSERALLAARRRLRGSASATADHYHQHANHHHGHQHCSCHAIGQTPKAAAKLLKHSRHIERKLYELEAKVDRIAAVAGATQSQPQTQQTQQPQQSQLQPAQIQAQQLCA